MPLWRKFPVLLSTPCAADRRPVCPPRSPRVTSCRPAGDATAIIPSFQDMFEITVEAFNISETYRTPVILLFDAETSHMREKLVVPEKGELPVVERLHTEVKQGVAYHPYLPREDGRLPMSDFGGPHRYNVTGLHHNIWGFPTQNPELVQLLNHHL